MSWMERLYQTYDYASSSDDDKPWPISHFVKTAHIEVVIDMAGHFKHGRARVLTGYEALTLIPATESSAGRAGAKVAPHPLCEELSYLAYDLPSAKPKKFNAYLDLLSEWSCSPFGHPKVSAVLKYVQRRTLWSDLSLEIEFPIKFKGRNGQSTSISPEKVFIRWRIESENNPNSGTWDDDSLINAWVAFDQEQNAAKGFCFISGGPGRPASNHSRFLRHASDGAKLISSNDDSGFTYRGRFASPLQSASVSFEVTQKAHNALRWLIERQGKRNGDQVIVAWAVSCTEIPSPLEEPFEYDLDDLSVNESAAEVDVPESKDFTRDLGFTFAQKLNQTMAGYKAKLDRADDTVVVMAIDSATPGRMGVVYYREHAPHDYIDVVARWHRDFAWPQRHKIEIPQLRGKPKETTVWLPFAPTPWLILNTAYGDIIKSNETLKKNLYERLLPCIVEGRNIPLDILNSAIRSVSNTQRKRMSEQYSTIQSEQAAWERDLGVACALYRGFYQRQPKLSERRKYSMALDRTNTSRDYLYGRLLAMAERIESVALNAAKVNRPTTANRLMQRFADRPFSTWRTVNQQLQPYLQQLQNSRTGFWVNSCREMDDIMGLFWGDDFTNDKALSGEYLLGFHCQRLALRESSTKSNTDSVTEIQEG